MDKHKKNGLYSLFSILFNFLNMTILVVIIIPFLPVKITSWWLDNLLSLQLQWSFLALVMLIINLKKFPKALIILTISCLMVVAYQQLSVLIPINKQQGTQPTLNIAQLNIRYDNRHIDKLIKQLNHQNYDLLALQEVADNWLHKIQTLRKHYPYSIGSSDADGSPSGLVLFSHWPIVERKIHDLGYRGGHIIEALVQHPKSNQPIHVFMLHPASPRNANLWDLRNATLESVAQLTAYSPFKYRILIGDLNTTPWSAQFERLQKNSLLNNSSDPFTYIPSWSYNKANLLTRLFSSAYIDHCLISDSFRVITKKQHTIEGSDHLLLSTELIMND